MNKNVIASLGQGTCSAAESKKRQIYFGTGLASMKEHSVGLGLGTLGMILAAAVEGKKQGTSSILHEIGIGYNMSEEERKKLTAEQMVIFNKLSEGLARLKTLAGDTIRLEHNVWTPEYLGSSLYAETLREVERILKASFNEIPNYAALKKYTAIQTAGVKLAVDNGAVSKIGWTPKGSVQDLSKASVAEMIAGKRISEYYFDQVLKHCFPELSLATRYIAGDIDWQTNYRKSPYTVTSGEVRPLVNQPIEKFYQENKERGYAEAALKDISKKIVMPYEELYGAIPSKRGTAAEETVGKVAAIQNQILGI